MKKFNNFIRESLQDKKFRKIFATTVVMTFLVILCCMSVFAEGAVLDIGFEFTSMFTWAQQIISTFMPVVYISLGVSFGFLVLRYLKKSF